MEEWTRQGVTQLKRLVKSRAGRIAELQMEIKVLEGLIERKVREGDLGGSSRKGAASPGPDARPGRPEPVEDKVSREESHAERGPKEEQPKDTKIRERSSNHAFEEIE